MNRSDIAAKLKTLIESQNDIVIHSYDDDLDIDSYMMMLIISYVEEEMGVRLDLEKLDFDAFKSLNTFAELVLQQIAEHKATH